MRLRVILGLLASALLAPPASAGSLPCDDPAVEGLVEPIQVCGTTVLTGETSGVVRVSIPQDVSLNMTFGPGQDLDISGSGRFIGFALVEIRQDATTGYRLVAGRYPAPIAGPSPYVWVDPSNETDPGDRPPAIELAGGEYALSLLADGSPVTVTLRPSGLSGTVRVEPRRPATFEPWLLEAPGIKPVNQVFGAGAPVDVPPGAMALVATAVTLAMPPVTPPGSYRFQACVHAGDPSPREIAYAPTCPRGDGGTTRRGTTYEYTGSDPFVRREWVFRDLAGGRHDIGGWYASTSLLADGAVFGFVLGPET